MSRDAIATNSDELRSAGEGVRVCVWVRLGFLGRGMYIYICVCAVGKKVIEQDESASFVWGVGGRPENMWVRFSAFSRCGQVSCVCVRVCVRVCGSSRDGARGLQEGWVTARAHTRACHPKPLDSQPALNYRSRRGSPRWWVRVRHQCVGRRGG